MEALYDSLQHAQRVLREAGIESVANGALAVNVWGRARATNDVDLKVGLERDQADTLLSALSPGYRPLGERPLDILQDVGFIFTLDSSGNRIDFLLADIGFDEEVLLRAVDVEVRPGLVVRVCSPEDLIVYKMISTRARDHEDARTVVARQSDVLDLGYVRRWLREFEIALDDSTLVSSFDEMVRHKR